MSSDVRAFVRMDQAQEGVQHIYVGETVTLKGELCRVKNINGRKIELELMSKKDRTDLPPKKEWLKPLPGNIEQFSQELDQINKGLKEIRELITARNQNQKYACAAEEELP